MKFSSTHARAFIGSNISVGVDADDKESIRSVNVTLDGFTLEDVELAPETSQYKQDFQGVGDASPEADHILIVSAMDQDLNPHSSQTMWTDS